MEKRTQYCGEINAANTGATVNIYGWIHSRRDHGGIIFIDLRDREGIVQAMFSPDNKELFALAQELRSEFVVNITGTVRKRPDGTENPKLKTGQIEVVANKLVILNTCETLPFEITDFIESGEELRLKYRYLDLRRNKPQSNIIARSKANQIIRNYLTGEGFLEIETPFLTKSTPEGARDFLVPSRLSPGTFYALPQSPQLFKQILMMSGFDKYFQIARCFRDEDLRADRQPEFTQVDIEMSFINENDILNVIEPLIKNVFEHVTGKKLNIPFMRMNYDDAISKYGTDRPDLRFDIQINNVTEIFKNTGFKIFNETASKGGNICAIKVPGTAFSREKMDKLVSYVNTFGAKGLAWIKMTDSGTLESPILKFFSQSEQELIKEKFNGPVPGTIFFVADTNRKVVYDSLGNLRVHLANELNLIDKTRYCFLWVENFPLFEWSDTENRIVACHHPFTAPAEEYLPILNAEVADIREYTKIKARAYDIILNGIELGGGSIRIHNPKLQEKIFRILQLDEKEINGRFGFLIKALQFGAPPHGGIALGLDRVMALLLEEDSIREVIAFPKTQKGSCPLTNGPDYVSPKQLKELNIVTINK